MKKSIHKWVDICDLWDMENQPKPRMIEVNRNQHILRPTDIEKLVEEAHPVRAVWDFVGKMDLSRFYASIGSVEGVAGREAWDPRLLISMWVYAYSRGIGSAREIERRCDYDPAFQWLTGMEVINHHTLSDFRISGKATLDELFSQTLGLLSAEGLISLERVMHDGTKIRANAGSDTFRTEKRIEEFLEQAQAQVKAMGDPREEQTTRREEKAKERTCRERKEKLELALKELEKIRESKADKDKARASITDPESRIMKHADGGFAPSYNAQISTESSHGIIIGASVTQSPTDSNELIPSLERIEDNFGQLPDQLVVDGGFTSRENMVRVADKQVDLIGSFTEKNTLALAQLKKRGVEEDFFPSKFRFDEKNNYYLCPADKILFAYGKEKLRGKTNYIYKAKNEECLNCPFKQRCCPQNKTGRLLIRKEEAAEVIAFKKKMETQEAKEIYKQRAPIAEFTNAWLKSKIGLRRFNVRGLIKVNFEMAWACITYNIQQWIRLKWAA